MTMANPDLWTELSLLDEKATLERLKGDKDFLHALYGVFIGDLPKKLTAIEEAASQGDLNTLQKSAHSLKGASATVGAEALRELAFSLETAAREENADLSAAIVPKLKDIAEKTQVLIEQSL